MDYNAIQYYISSSSIVTGEFGVVYRGHLVDYIGTKPTELVAVKTLKEGESVGRMFVKNNEYMHDQTLVCVYF